MHALIVDDSRFVRQHTRRLLEGQGFDCDEAPDGLAAMECLRGGTHFDVALIDCNMPVVDGIDMVRTLRAEGFTDLKVMMVTTEGECGMIQRALYAGADEFLMKPFGADALVEKLALLGLEAG